VAYRLQEASAEEEGRRAVAAEERRAGARSPPRIGGRGMKVHLGS
jgi:hypothetical protein